MCYVCMYCGQQHMENEQEAQQAIRSLNGHNLNGNRINVEVRLELCIHYGPEKYSSRYLTVTLHTLILRLLPIEWRIVVYGLNLPP